MPRVYRLGDSAYAAEDWDAVGLNRHDWYPYCVRRCLLEHPAGVQIQNFRSGRSGYDYVFACLTEGEFHMDAGVFFRRDAADAELEDLIYPEDNPAELKCPSELTGPLLRVTSRLEPRRRRLPGTRMPLPPLVDKPIRATSGPAGSADRSTPS